MALDFFSNIFVFFANGNWGKASRRTAFCQGRVGQSISKIGAIRLFLLLMAPVVWLNLDACSTKARCGTRRRPRSSQRRHTEGKLDGSKNLKCVRSCRPIHHKWTWWTDHLTIWPSNIFLLTFPWNISLSKRQNLSHHQAHELVESLWRSGVEPVILGNRVSRRFVVCWLCVVNIQFCTIFEVGACCSMHLTSFDKKIPFELLSYLGWSFHQRGQFPTTNGSATASRCQDVQNETLDLREKLGGRPRSVSQISAF